jgi:uncharacterized protein with HEPN domain
MWRDDAYLLDILLSARKAIEFTQGLSKESFEQSELHQNAVARVLAVVGEAASKISPEFRKSHPEIPWQKAVGMRHRLIHDYVNVNLDKVWDTVQNSIPDLIRLVEPLVPPKDKFDTNND